MKAFLPQKVYIATDVIEHPRTRNILKKLESVEVVPIDDHRKVDSFGASLDGKFAKAKKRLAIAIKKGMLVKEFRRHPALEQEREFYLLHAANCPYDCAYCYLQCYFQNATPTIFVNLEEMFDQVSDVLAAEPDREILFHAGEIADALALEHLSGFAADAVRFFADRENACLELRTKSANIENILPLSHNRKTIVSWTLTPHEIGKQYERAAPPLKERLQAASRCQRAGYPVGLRFDPMIHYNGWRKGYRTLVETISECLEPEGIHSIALGGFRFPPPLREIIIERWGRTELVLDEFVPLPDGKLRYFRHIREELYREMIALLSGSFGEEIKSKIKLAMEPAYICRNIGLKT